MNLRYLIILIFVLSLALPVDGYEIDTPLNVTHQHITNESQKVWPLIPYEIKIHLKNSISRDTNNNNYNIGDDIIDGSREEDRPFLQLRFFRHFWQPDDPDTLMVGNDDYNDGLFAYDSSYRTALGYWTNNMIPAYLRGDINESYYWLGRVAHLLEDATSTPHTNLDPHPPGDTSVLEKWAGGHWNQYNGNNHIGLQYNYENLIDSFNWSQVQPTRVPDNQNIELFRLFWYTAQKTQYWASEGSNGNQIYVDLDEGTRNWQCGTLSNSNLWKDESYSCSYFVNDSNNVGYNNVEKQANATIPHAMKAVAGLYRLFDDAVRVDWPTENHDYRRTGFTLLKGDLATKAQTKNQVNLVLDDVTGTAQVVKAVVADLDGNSFMDSVVLLHKTTFNTYTKMYGIENQKIDLKQFSLPSQLKTVQKWPVKQIDGGAIWFPASLGNIDSDSRKEIVTGTRNGTIYAYDVDANGKITEKWRYHLEKRFSPLASEDTVNFNGGTAIVDIDLDGTNDIVFADVGPSVGEANWNGKVYVLDGSGSTPINKTSYNVGNGGTYATISVANVDSDDYPEIIVPTQFGVKVLDYNPSTGKLTEKCSNTHGLIEGSAVIYDVDKENEYELIYVTSDRACASGKTCLKRLYILNASSCTIELEKTFTEYPRPTPTVANLDSDSQSEIIVSSVSNLITGLGTISAVDSSSGTTQWTYNNGGTLHPGFISPNMADIDNDGNYNVILGENNNNTVYILKHDGTELYKYTVSGFMDNGLAIADIDDDKMAEIVFKRAGSPTQFTSISSSNTPPELNSIPNITAIAGDLINLNATGKVSAFDAESNDLTFYYSSPFNSSGQWQTTINDTGNYSIMVEASDGNLSSYQFVDVVVFNSSTKGLTQSSNITTKIRIPKNATIVYAKLTMKGGST